MPRFGLVHSGVSPEHFEWGRVLVKFADCFRDCMEEPIACQGSAGSSPSWEGYVGGLGGEAPGSSKDFTTLRFWNDGKWIWIISNIHCHLTILDFLIPPCWQFFIFDPPFLMLIFFLIPPWFAQPPPPPHQGIYEHSLKSEWSMPGQYMVFWLIDCVACQKIGQFELNMGKCIIWAHHNHVSIL